MQISESKEKLQSIIASYTRRRQPRSGQGHLHNAQAQLLTANYHVVVSLLLAAELYYPRLYFIAQECNTRCAAV